MFNMRNQLLTVQLIGKQTNSCGKSRSSLVKLPHVSCSTSQLMSCTGTAITHLCRGKRCSTVNLILCGSDFYHPCKDACLLDAKKLTHPAVCKIIHTMMLLMFDDQKIIDCACWGCLTASVVMPAVKPSQRKECCKERGWKRGGICVLEPTFEGKIKAGTSCYAVRDTC